MASTTVTNIESKTQATKYLSFKSLMLFIFYMLICYMFMDFVYEPLHIPYLLFSGVCCMFMLMPSAYNVGRNNIESIIILLSSDKQVYRFATKQSIEWEEETDAKLFKRKAKSGKEKKKKK